MNNRANILFIFILSLLCGSIQAKDLPVIPQPQNVKYLNENFIIKKDLKLALFVDDTTRAVRGVKELRQEFKQFFNSNLILNDDTNADLCVGLKNVSNEFDKLCTENNFEINNELGSQGYQILINANNIIIAANEKPGMYYGIQTLKQLLRAYKDEGNLPGVFISDYPDLKYRGMMDDISRGPVPTLEFMKYQIRRLAEMKMNIFHHYIEHVVKTKKHGEFAPSDGSITIDEWKELSDYAQEYFVTLVGGFQSFGHFSNILSNPKYSHLGESGTLISPVLPESIEFLKDIYKEMIPAFNAPWFAINCDETFDLGRGYSKELVEKYGYAYVYKMHIMNLYDIVKSMGKKVWIWGDIMLKYPELMRELPKDIIVGTWNYDGRDSFDDYIKPFAQNGFETLIVPGVLNSSRVMPEWNEAITNIHNFIRDGVKYNSFGFLNTVWDDGGFAFFSIDWYGVAYSADQGWNSSERNLESFNTRFNEGLNADTTNNFTKALWKILEIGEHSPTGKMTQKVVWQKVIPEKYESLNISLEEWDKIISVCDEAKELLNNSSPELYKEQLNYFHFIIDLYKSLAQKRFDLLDASNNYKDAAVLQDENPDSARSLLLNTLEKIARVKLTQQMLTEDYKKLWLAENHTYSLMKIVDRFNKEINDLIDLENLVFEALKQFDEGLYIPAPIEVRLAINEVNGKYFREWMMINPLPNIDGLANSKIDYLTDMGGQVHAQPRVTQEFSFNNEKYRWRRVMTDYFDIVDLDELFPQKNENAVMYAHATITSPISQTVKAAVGSDDGITVFINGVQIFKYDYSRTLVPDEDIFEIKLNKGTNHLLIKISQLTNEWGYSFRLPECRIQNSKNRYYIK